MKTFTFKLFGRTITFTFGRKKAEELSEEIKMEEAHHYIPFSDYCDQYIESQKGILTDATLKGYRNIVDNHLMSLMTCDIDDVCETLIQDAFVMEIAKGLSTKTLKSYKSFVLKVIREYYPETFKPEIRIEKEEIV